MVYEGNENNPIHELEVNYSQTVGQVKESIAENIGVPADQQLLIYKGTKWIDNNQPFSDCEFDQYHMHIIINTKITFQKGKNKTEVNLNLDLTKTIGRVKSMILNKISKTGYSVGGNPTLYFNSRELDDDKTFDFYGIKKASTLDLKNIKINVEDSIAKQKETFDVTINLIDTVEDLKKMIQVKKGYPADEQILSYDNIKKSPVVLTDNGKKLNDYGINENVLLLLKAKKDEKDEKNQDLNLWLVGLPIAVIVVCVAIYAIYALSQKAKRVDYQFQEER